MLLEQRTLFLFCFWRTSVLSPAPEESGVSVDIPAVTSCVLPRDLENLLRLEAHIMHEVAFIMCNFGKQYNTATCTYQCYVALFVDISLFHICCFWIWAKIMSVFIRLQSQNTMEKNILYFNTYLYVFILASTWGISE